MAEGFEPSVRGYRTQHFECCTFGRSDTPPPRTVPESAFSKKSAGQRYFPVSLSLTVEAASLTFSPASLTADCT